MKIISNFLKEINGIEYYYIAGLLIFMTLFVIIFVKTYRTSNSKMDELKNIVFDEKDNEIKNSKI